jgi:hypothetical protein
MVSFAEQNKVSVLVALLVTHWGIAARSLTTFANNVRHISRYRWVVLHCARLYQTAPALREGANIA